MADLERSQVIEMASRGGSLRGVDLSNVDLSGLDLRNANFEGADCTRCNFDGAVLDGAKFDNASLHSATFRKTNLHNASMNQANLCRADLRTASFQNTSICNANLENTHIDPLTIGGANLRGSWRRTSDNVHELIPDHPTTMPEWKDTRRPKGIAASSDRNPYRALRLPGSPPLSANDPRRFSSLNYRG